MVKIITDTLACMPEDFAQQYHIPVIPQIINFGEESFREGIEMDNKAFLARLKTSKELPKTAAPAPEWFKAEFEKLIPSGGPILCIHPSAEISGTVRSASVAKQDFPDADIRIIDTRVIGSPLGVMVMVAARWAAAGVDADTIVNRLHSMIQRCVVYFLVDTLDYLARGGRIGNAAALVGSILQIKPILVLRDGVADVYQKERTHKRALECIKQLVKDQYPGQAEDYGYFSIMEADALTEAKNLEKWFKAEFGVADVPIVNLPPAIITHGGPGTIGVSFFTKEKV